MTESAKTANGRRSHADNATDTPVLDAVERAAAQADADRATIERAFRQSKQLQLPTTKDTIRFMLVSSVIVAGTVIGTSAALRYFRPGNK
jgi:hypothetical protein